MTAELAITGATLVLPEGLRPGTLVIAGGRVQGIAEGPVEAAHVIDATGLHVLPGLIDIHAHIRAPAYPRRGTVETETAAAAAGGITTVFEMPITDPCCNSPARVALRRDHFAGRAQVNFGLYAAPVELDPEAVQALADSGIVGFKIFTTPAPPGREAEFAGLAWPDAADQARALALIAATGLPVVVHAEHPQLLDRAEAVARATRDPADARTHGAARPAMAEALAVAQLLTLNMAAQARLHIAHVTSAATVAVLRRFAGSSDFSAETCPHYLAFTEADVARAGVAARVNPPIRCAEDREALWQAIADGVIGHVTTDHAGFAPEEKAAHAGNFLTAPPGHPGFESLLPILLDALVAGRLSLTQVAELTAGAAARRFGLPDRGRIAPGAIADLALVDLTQETRITEAGLHTAARASAALTLGTTWRGRLVRTILAGRTIWPPLGPAQGRFVTPTGARPV